jgi:hypothetical protein
MTDLQPPRLLVTGSRAFTDPALMRAALTYAGRLLGRNAVLVHGGARGADQIAALIWTDWGLPTDAHPADWDTCTIDCPDGHRKIRADGSSWCPTAGFRRNQEMVDAGAELCLAFPIGASTGTGDCRRRAAAAGIETFTITNFDDLADAYLTTPTAVIDDQHADLFTTGAAS